MPQQSISQRLDAIGNPLSKAVIFYLNHPEHNPLTEEEKEVALAVMGELKFLDGSWTIQRYMSNYMVNASICDTNDIAFEALRNVPRLFHALALTNPAQPSKDGSEEG